MRADDDLDRRMTAWMTETTSGPASAGRFEQAIAATARRRPRPRWLAAPGSDWVGTATHAPVLLVSPGRRARLAVATVFLMAVAVVGVSIFGRSAVTRPSVGAPGATPTHGPSGGPIPLPPAGAVAPGTYFLNNPCVDRCPDYRRIIFTLPAGWATRDGLVYKYVDRSHEVAFSAWTVDQVYADPCHWQASTLSPLDLANHSHDQAGAIILAPEAGGLANQALRGPTPRALTPVSLGGQSALRIDLSVPAGLDMSTCDSGEFRSWTDVVYGANSHHSSGQLDTVYEIDLDKRPLVIDASHMPATSPEDQAELKAVLASIVIDRGGPADTPSPAATATPPSAPPGFELLMTEVHTGRLDPGTYEYLNVDEQGFNVRFTVPAGWTWDGRSLSKGGVDQPDGAAIFFFGGPLQVYADPCHWAGAQPTPPTGLSVDDLVAALAAQASRSATTPIARPANVPGLANRWPGMSVVLHVPDNVDLTACDGGQYRSWGPDNKARSHQGPGQRDLVWAIDIGGTDTNPGGLVIDAASFPGTPADALFEIDAILGSIAIGHWG